jgi:hypothetical protein
MMLDDHDLRMTSRLGVKRTLERHILDGIPFSLARAAAPNPSRP